MTLLLSLILLFIVVLLVNEAYQSRLGVPCMPTMPRARRRMLSLIPPGEGPIVELGSGWGGMAVAAARAHPGRQVTGLELSLFPYLFSRLRPRPKNLSIRRADFFKYPLHDADAVLCYLTNPLMEKLRPKFAAELKPGARVISSTFFIPRWRAALEETVKTPWPVKIFVYEKGGEE